MIHRKEGANRRRAADSRPIATAGASPQASGIVGPPPQRGGVEVSPGRPCQATAIPVIRISAGGWEGVGRALHGAGAQAALG